MGSSMYCRPGQYCNTLTMECEKVKAINDECTLSESCGYGRQCIRDPTLPLSSPLHCAAWKSIQIGKELYNPSQVMCESGYIRTVVDPIDESKKYYCEKAPKFIKESEGETCLYTSYKTENGVETSSEVTSPSHCGFNIDSKSYCSKYTPFTAFDLTSLMTLINTGLNCHVQSKGFDQCMSIRSSK
jgi:hypothetical protein